MLIKERTILIAETDFKYFCLLEEILSVLGCDVLYAGSSKSTVEMVKSNSIDMLLIDMTEINLNGLDTIKQIRKFNGEIIIVGQVGTRNSQLVKSAGGDDIITKPCDGQDLSKLIEKYFLIAEHNQA